MHQLTKLFQCKFCESMGKAWIFDTNLKKWCVDNCLSCGGLGFKIG